MEDPLRLQQAPDLLTLTFGVELEFVVRFKPGEYADDAEESRGWDPMHGDRARAHIRAVLDEEFSANYECERIGQSIPGFEKWDLGSDASIHVWELSPPPDEGRFDYYSMELRSPALPYTTASLSHVREVFRRLFSTFDILVNKSCGLHVHVGNGLKGFPLQTLKNLCILTATFERELENLHPPSRIGNEYSQSSGALFVGISPWDIEKIIKSTRHENDLIFLVQNGEKGYAYNLLNLGGQKGTIEFRQHEATLNVDDIIEWVELTCSLVEKAHEFATEDHYDLDQTDLRRYHLDDYLDATYHLPNRSILDVLANLGLDGLAEYYGSRGLFTHSRPAWAWADPCQEDTMAPWIDADDRFECFHGEIVSRSVANSKENRKIYWEAVLACAKCTYINVPCEHDSTIGAESSWECFCDYWDCRSRAESRTTALGSVCGVE